MKNLLLLLLAWLLLGMPVQAQEPPSSPASAEQAAEADPMTQLVTLYGQMASFSFRVGNFLASARILESFDAFLASCGKLAPGHEAELAQAHQSLQVLQFANLAFAGQPTAAIDMGNQLLKAAKKDEDVLMVLHMVLLHAGRVAGRPQVVDQNLPIVLKMAYATSDASGSLYRFTAETQKFERELQRNPQIDDAAFMARHQKVWKLLEPYKVDQEDSQGEGRLFGEALRFWMLELGHRGANSKNEAQKAQLKALFEKDFEVGNRLASEAINTPDKANVNPEFFVSLMDVVFDLAESARLNGKPEIAREALTSMESDFQKMVAVFEEADVEMNRALSEAVRVFISILPEMEKVGIVFDPRPFQFSLMEGDISRLLTRYHQQWVRQILSESGSKLKDSELDNLKKRLTAAANAQQKASKGLGYLGMEDIGWDILDVLFARRGQGWLEGAQAQIDETLKICNALNYRPGQISALSYLGQLQVARSQKPAAMESLKKATQLAEEYILEVGGSSAAAGRIKERYRKAYDLLAELQIEANQTDEAFSTLGRLQQMQSVASGPAPTSNQTISKFNTLRGQSQALQQEIVHRKAAGLDTRPAEQLLARTKAEFFTTLSEIRRQNPQYESLLAIRPVNFSKLQKFIPADTAIVQYFPSQNGLYIFVATHTDLRIHKVDTSAEELKKLVQTFRRLAVIDYTAHALSGAPPLAMNSNGGKADKLIVPLRQNLFRLHQLLVDPVEQDIADKKVIAFIPTGVLNYLPMAAVARPAGNGVEFLAQRKQCVTLLKSSDLDQLGRTPAAPKGAVLALGNPDGSLPEAVKEVEGIARLFNSQAFVGNQATRARLKQLPGIAYLHLATHGVLDTRDPGSSYLLLAGKPEEARLSIPQIYELKLDGLRLVTLSACQTAVGEREPGSELTTLADAFSIAGTQSVVASLWSVADDSTQKLMVEFYAQLRQGKSLAEALQQAEVKLIASDYSHPFYWAPFVLIGDWR